MLSYAWRDLVRNPRRTLASLVGVTLGVGLLSSVLFFIDGSGATMTTRAIAPLALDMQRVLTSPLGGGLRLEERISGPAALRVGQRAKVTLTVRNEGAEPAHEVVVNDEPPRPLTYVPGTTTLRNRALHDQGNRIPLARGRARAGLNIGTVAPRTSVTLTYIVRAARAVTVVAALEVRGTISSRESFVPAPANPPPQIGLARLQAKIAGIPGVAASDGLSFVDLPPGSLQAGGSTVGGPVRVFAFDRHYPTHYPSIRLVSGSLSPPGVVLSVESARALEASPGQAMRLRLPGRAPLSLQVGGVADLGQAKPLFYSRASAKLEDFLYIRNAAIVTPATFRREIIPAFRVARAKRGSMIKAQPVQEIDVLVDRSRLRSDPAAALTQTKAIARAIDRIAPGQDYLIDNISNTLQVARDDAAVGRRMFLFLGLPGALLAAFLSAHAGSILALAQRREHAALRVRGAHRGHLLRTLLYRTLVLAGLGSVLGIGLGLLSAVVILTPKLLFDASPRELVASSLVAIGAGMLTTALALFIPGLRSLNREVVAERREIAGARVPARRHLVLDLVLVAAVVVAEASAYRAGIFDPPTVSVSTGEAVVLPSRLLLAPLVTWFGGTLVLVRIFTAIASRLPLPSPSFGPVIGGILKRSLRRRPWSLGTGIVGVGLVTAFGTTLALFASTYDTAKAADARFIVGSDVRITPRVLSPRARATGFASRLLVRGVSAVTPVVSKPENAVLIGPDNQDRADLAAIYPEGFGRVAAPADSGFVERPAAAAMAALRADPRGLLVDSETAGNLGIRPGDHIQVLLARGTKHQTLRTFHVTDLFVDFPGFPQHTSVVANLHYYQAATRSSRVDFFLARTTDRSPATLARAVSALRSGPGRRNPLDIESTATALDKDQSSLTALNIHGLVRLNLLYTLLMSAAGVAIYVFGLMLQRHREYVTLRAQGLQTLELQALVLGEAVLVAVCGLVAGILVGTATAYFLVHVLRSLFILDPGLSFEPSSIATLTILVMGATLLSALGATAMLRRLKPGELLREA